MNKNPLVYLRQIVLLQDNIEEAKSALTNYMFVNRRELLELDIIDIDTTFRYRLSEETKKVIEKVKKL